LSQTFTEKLEVSIMDENDNTSLERGAADDIVRLRWRLKIRENVVARLQAENERLRTRATHATPSECSVPRNGAVAARETVCPHIRGTVTQHCSLNLTLADEEREAILTAADLLIGSKPGVILRHLLVRLS